jgi:cyclase
MIELIPAIDLIDGKCVRLTKGDYAQKTVYNEDPVAQAKEFERLGFRRLHVVDLDGAKSKHIVNDAVLRRITEETRLVVDFGGGIKTNDDLEKAFRAGAAMVTVGSIAVTHPDLFLSWLDRYGAERLILGADVRNGKVSINGWKEDSAEDLLPFLRKYIDHGVRNVLCTEISKDGTLSGPATDLYRRIMAEYPQLHLIASGGVSSTDDILELEAQGIPAVVFGKAYYEGRIDTHRLGVTKRATGLAKRIIPCLDVKDGETVKGTNFVNLRSAGDPVELGKAYSEAGADELVFLDITASYEGRKTFTEMVERVAREINIPFTVGGGINELADVERLLHAGADKVSVNSAALRRPQLIDEITSHFGSQVCVAAIDARLDDDGWYCYVKGGRERTERGLFDWAREVADRGAGEILFTSMNHDGVKQGFANEALARMAEEVPIPIIASGGAGAMEHFRDAFIKGKADAALAASVFHFGEISIPELKQYLRQEGINVRLAY